MSDNGDSSKNRVRIRMGDNVSTVELETDEICVGRAEGVDLRIAVAAVSRRHARIRIQSGRVTISDLGSANGTFVAGSRLKMGEEVEIPGPGTEVSIGDAAYISVLPARREHEATVPSMSSLASVPSISVPETGATEISQALKPQPAARRTAPEAAVPQESSLSVVELDLPSTRQALDPMIAQLKAQAEALNSEVWKLKTQRIQCERELQGKRQALEAEIDAARTELSEVAGKARHERETYEQESRARREALEAELRDTRVAFEEEFKSAGEAIERAKQQKREIEEKLRSKREQVDAALAELHEKRETAENAALTALATLEEKQAELRRQLETLLNQRDDAAEETQRIKAEAMVDLERSEERSRALRAEADITREEIARSRDTIDKLREEAAQLHVAVTELGEKREKLGLEIPRASDELARLQAELAQSREAARRETEARDYELRKTKAQFDAMDAEYQVKKLDLQADIGEIKLQQVAARQELQESLSQREQALAESDRLRAEAASRREEIARSQDELARAREEAARGQAVLAELMRSIEAARVDAERVAAEAARTQSESRAEAARAHAQYQAETERARAECQEQLKIFDEQIAERRKGGEAQLAEALRAAEASKDAEAARRHQQIEQELTEKAARLERELADAKLTRLKEIEKLHEEAAAAERGRRAFMLDEIVRGAAELSRQRPITELEGEYRKFVTAVLEGKTVGTLSADAARRTKRFWQRVGIWSGAPAAAVLILVLFPGIPRWFSSQVNRTIASEQKNGGVFLDEIHKKGMKFQPPMDRNYRSTYADNILYLEGYVDMKLDDESQKQWILVLNDFIVGRLGLSDRVIPQFISAETVMVKDLLTIRQGILPDFKDQGLQRMAETEKQENPRLVSLLEGDDNYRKFREFEDSFYQKYIGERGKR